MGFRRAHLAVLAGVLWLLAFDVVPMAHVVFHEALDAHEHGHSHGHSPDEEEPQSPSEHGEGSVAHRDLAAQAPPVSIPRVLEALLAFGSQTLPTYDEVAADGRPRTTRARAPPNAML
jgi:hypothetical protein